MLNYSEFYKKLFVLRLIFGLIVLFCLPTSHLSAIGIKNIQPVFNDRFYSEQKYLSQINFRPPAFQTSGKKIIVAIIDEGVDFTHPDLQSLDSGKSWNFLDNNNNLTPKGPHGTRLAGIIAANPNNYEGVVGMAQNAKIMSLIACDAAYGCSPSAIIQAIYYVADNGASAINLSFGDTAGYSEIYNSAIAYANHKGVIIVAAAGGVSQGLDLSEKPISPVCNDRPDPTLSPSLGSENMVIGVSSIDENSQLTSWANYGNCVDIYGPGTNIFTTASSMYDGTDYGYFSGSSYSAGIVMGFIAAAKSINPNLSQAQAIQLFKNQRLDVDGSLLLINQKIKAAPKVKGAKALKTKGIQTAVKTLKINPLKEKFR
ncbi:MAG: S8 family serine peptidase [Candidatus Doudnabacteria bacterium]|nr:S8 family serine peptidase [Candidatus Doudnabacteria bacterium]